MNSILRFLARTYKRFKAFVAEGSGVENLRFKDLGSDGLA